jgi:hypothetical protein
MKFDAARTVSTLRDLGDKRFAGTDGEAQVAAFAAERLGQSGWDVERRVVAGSELPRLSISWMGWWLLALPVAAATAMFWSGRTHWLARVLASLLLLVAASWAYLGLVRGLRFGWRIGPLKQAPLVIARPRSDRVAVCRVVLVAPLGALSAIPGGSWTSRALVVSIILPCLLLCIGLSLAAQFASERSAAQLDLWRNGLAIGLSGLIVVTTLALSIEGLLPRNANLVLDRHERTGIAVLLEMARTWPSSRKEPLELLVAGVGGQTLDFAGARALQSMALFEQDLIPTLFVLLLGPGPGVITTISSDDCRELAQSAAKSLWLPHRSLARSLAWLGLWPEEPAGRDLVALVGAGVFNRRPAVGTIDPAALAIVAQLATEITLRWSKERRRATAQSDSVVASSASRRDDQSVPRG